MKIISTLCADGVLLIYRIFENQILESIMGHQHKITCLIISSSVSFVFMCRGNGLAVLEPGEAGSSFCARSCSAVESKDQSNEESNNNASENPMENR